MITLVTVIHVLVCVFLILVILLQAGKGGGMGAGLGGGGSQTVFGGRGAQTFLGKVTSVSAAVFMLTSLTLAYNSSHTKSVMDSHAIPAPSMPVEQGSPFAPGTAPAAPVPTSDPVPAPVPAPAPQK